MSRNEAAPSPQQQMFLDLLSRTLWLLWFSPQNTFEKCRGEVLIFPAWWACPAVDQSATARGRTQRAGRATGACTAPQALPKAGEALRAKQLSQDMSGYRNFLKNERKKGKSCPALCNSTNCSPPGNSVRGILQARILEWVAIPSSGVSSQPRRYPDGIFFTV